MKFNSNHESGIIINLYFLKASVWKFENKDGLNIEYPIKNLNFYL